MSDNDDINISPPLFEARIVNSVTEENRVINTTTQEQRAV